MDDDEFYRLIRSTARDTSISDEYERYAKRALTKPAYKTYAPIPAPPEFFLVQFIGGFKNAQQEFYPYKAWFDKIQSGKRFDVTDVSRLEVFDDGKTHSATQIQLARYTLTLIPREETPFAQSAQVVIALFQE